MITEPTHIIVQHVRDESPELFRVIAYRGITKFHPVEFASLAKLLEAFRTVMPDFEESRILIRRPEERLPYIACIMDRTLTDEELGRIGLWKV